MAASPGPLVSIVTASFNAVGDLRQTVQSVASQSFRSHEHIVIDGGSSDGTRQYLEGLGDDVRWVSEPDAGIADALNKGVAMAKGEYVLVLQAGDRFVGPESIERATRHLRRGADLVGFDVLFERADGSAEVLPSRPLSVATRFRVLNPHQGLFCRRRVFQEIGGFDTSFRICMDYQHLLRATRHGFALEVVRDVLTVMPDGGISSRSEWPARRALLAEQRRSQLSVFGGRLYRFANGVFWALFYPAYFLKWHVLRNVKFY